MRGFGATGGQRVGPQALVIIPLVLALVGIGLNFVRLPAQRLFIAIASAAGAGCLIAFVVEVANNVRNTTTPLVATSVTFGFGLTGSMVLFIAVAAANVVLYVEGLKQSRASRGTQVAGERAGRLPPHPPPVPG